MASVLRLVTDGLRNAITGAGTRYDARGATSYIARALTQQEIEQAYRGSGLMRKIVAIPALDMVREWRDWSGLDAKQTAKLYDEEKRLGLRQKVRQAEVLRGLGGGALILGLPGEPAQPAPANVSTNGLAYVHVVSRWHLTFERVEDDARLPGFGEPAMWRMNATGGQVAIHPSRIIAFRADTTAGLASTMSLGRSDEAFWGESTVAQVLDAVKDSDTARASFAALLHKARLTRFGIPNLSETVSMPGGQDQISARLATLAMAESIHNAAIYDSGNGGTNPGEAITDAVYNFDGAKDVINAFNEFVAAISDIPATRLLGRAPEGMNSSGESQQTDWRKKVRAMQTLELAPCLDRLDRYLVPSALGTVPPEASYDFAPLDTPGEKENAERFKLQMEAAEKLSGLAAMPERAFNRGLQSLLIEEGYLPELEVALAEIPEEERYGVEAEPDEGDETDEFGEQQRKGGDPASAGAGGEGLEAEPPRRAANDAAPRTLYVSRKLLNADELIAWAKAQGFETTLPASEMHVTITYSRQALDWLKVESEWGENDGKLTVAPGGARIVEPLGDKGAIVLLFNSSALSWRHEAIKRAGASHDFDEFQPHVTITYAGGEVDLEKAEPFRGKLVFGPEIFEELDEGWKPSEA